MTALPFWTEQDMAPHAQWQPMVAHLRQQHQLAPAQVNRLLMEQVPDSPVDATQGLLVWPAWQRGGHIGVKVVTLFPDNKSKPTVQGLVLLFDAHDGSPLCAMDGTALTRWKTAADSALGAQLLANSVAHTLLMVGAGAMAAPLIAAHMEVRPSIRRVLIWNRSPEKARDLTARIRVQAKSNVQVHAVADLQRATADAQIICCATGSKKPLIKGSWVSAGSHIDLVGAYTPEMREADDDLLKKAHVYVDSKAFTLTHVGDLTQAFSSGALQPKDIKGDLFELCKELVPARNHPDQITVFKSGGGAHLDLMMAQYFHSRCSQANAYDATSSQESSETDPR